MNSEQIQEAIKLALKDAEQFNQMVDKLGIEAAFEQRLVIDTVQMSLALVKEPLNGLNVTAHMITSLVATVAHLVREQKETTLAE